MKKFLLFLLFCFPHTIFAQNISSQIPPEGKESVTNITTNDNVFISDSLSEKLSFGTPYPIKISAPDYDELIDIDTSNLSFRDTSIEIKKVSNEGNTISLEMTPYEVKDFIIPPLLLTGVQKGVTNQFYIMDIPVKMKDDFETPKGLNDLEKNFFLWDSFYIALLVIFIVIIIIILLVWWIYTHKEGYVKKKKLEKIDPFQNYLAKLTLLKNKLEKDDFDNKLAFDIATDLSMATRSFLESQYNFSFLEASSRDIVRFLKQEESDIEFQELVEVLLKKSDRVKYAKHIPDKETLLTLINQAFELRLRRRYILENIEEGQK